MDKDKKNIDYWDKYYGSGKDKKYSPPEYNEKYNAKSQKEKTSASKSGRKNPEPSGRIVGSEYKKTRMTDWLEKKIEMLCMCDIVEEYKN